MSQRKQDRTGKLGEPILFLPKSVIAAAAACAGLFFLQQYVLSDAVNARVLHYLAFIPARISEPGSVFLFFSSAVTSSLLHASFAHLAINLIWLAAFGAPLAARIGAGRFASFWFFTAFCATALHFFTHIGDFSPLVGASGVVSGAMGAAARFGFAASGSDGPRAFSGAPLSFAEASRSKSVVSFVLVWALVNFISGAGVLAMGQGSASIAWQAHIGGFIAGFFGLKFFDVRPLQKA